MTQTYRCPHMHTHTHARTHTHLTIRWCQANKQGHMTGIKPTKSHNDWCGGGRKASVVQNAQVAGHYLVLQHGAGGNVDAVSMVGDDDDGALWGRRRRRGQRWSWCSKVRLYPILAGQNWQDTGPWTDPESGPEEEHVKSQERTWVGS